ncbi:MAG: ornithine carbamoyltransferase [Candidatus Omnitrophica bacterium CG11_big_fil_rev_8_21_14_0_20_64_10]|nr:MAG: ornithine carbamoyltransferase [Candidatus Omnitrophica bacterium CG11_big_fil_rev_8_21_14_0_20_64_10]
MKTTHLLTVRQLSAVQINTLLKEAAALKRKPLSRRTLSGKVIGLLFHKPSVRTRVSFEVGIRQLGGESLYLGSGDLGGASREAPRDLARVLCRYLDGIVARTFAQTDVTTLAEWSPIPVINGLTDSDHPCQALSDLLTIRERFGKLRGIGLAYIGDGNNVCRSLMEGAALTGIGMRVATPAGHAPDPATVAWCRGAARKSGGTLLLTRDPREAAEGAQVLYTDVWTSMGQEKERVRRLKAFRGFQINGPLMRRAARGAVFMHCLPAHRGEEVSSELLDSPASIVYDQAENRLHLQKAVWVSLFRSKQ